MTKISVAIAAYCGEKYILRQLESLFCQTRKIQEIIICDDSPEPSLFDLVSRLIPEAPCSIKIFRNEKKLGPAGNFAKAVSLCTGDLIFLCDQDDVWKEDKVEKLASVLENDENTDVVFCNSLVVDPDLVPLGYSTTDILCFTAEKSRHLNSGKGVVHLLRTPMTYGHNIAFRQSFRSVLLPLPPMVSSHDLFIAELSAGRGKIRCVYEDLTLHRRHEKNQTLQNDPGLSGRIRMLFFKQKTGKNTEIYDSFIHAWEAWNRLDTLRQKGLEEPPEENMRLLKSSAVYYKTRLLLTEKSRWIRPFFLFTVKGYFSLGCGFRSMIRDLLF